MNKQSLTKNFLLQFIYQALILVVPMIISPYLTRTLQKTALGEYTFSNSIAYYFVLLSMLGISRYGQRIIAEASNDILKLRKTFWSLFTVHSIFSIVFTVLYILLTIVVFDSHKMLYFIQTLYVLSALFDITWLFYGLENFQSVVIKNTIIKVGESVLILILVKKPSDVFVYAFIVSCGVLLGQIVMLPQAAKIIKPISFDKSDAIKHIKPLLLFSISVLASALYTVFDKTLLGILASKESVAFYEYSNNIVRVPRTIIGVIGTVLFPRACKLAANGDIKGQNRYIKLSFDITAFIGIGTIFGLLSIADLFARIYYGESFSECGGIMKALSPIAFIIGVGEVVRTQFMIPNHMDKQFNICIVLNAIVNLIVSIIFIPYIGVYGAVIGTLTAEVFGVVFQMYLCRKSIKISMLLLSTLPFIIIGLIMWIVLLTLQISLGNSVASLLIQVGIGVVLYSVLSLSYIFILRKDLFSILTSSVTRKLKKDK